MKSFSLTEAKARLSKPVERAVAGKPIEITRRGKPVVRLIAIEQPRKRMDVASLRALAETMPEQQESTRRFIRRTRDNSRY
jgi:prevent-host-death family protein